VTLNSYTLRPKSRGSVSLRSADPRDTPLVDPNFLAEPDDLRISVEGVKTSREIFSQPSLAKYIREIRHPDQSVRTQADFEAYARQYGRTSYHPVSSCRMGQDEMAVVDPQLRVRGLDGLRICDSSVMPSLIGSNTNAPTIMIGEKAADLIRGNA
jgi:choline dehydrogenase-like flavoprotein